jgi:uncharacterized membrane protein YoaK (UPF0700 family)
MPDPRSSKAAYAALPRSLPLVRVERRRARRLAHGNADEPPLPHSMPTRAEAPGEPGLDLTTGALLGALLGAVAGAVDAAGWVCLGGLLPSHLTASLVILGASLGEHESADVSARLAMIPVFILSVAFVKWLSGLLAARKLPLLPPLLTLLSLALLLFALAGALSDSLLADDPRVLFGVGGIGVASMAVQNTIMRLCLTRLNPTTVMTGNLTQFVMASIDLTTRPLHRALTHSVAGADEQGARARLRSAGLPLLGFVAGSVSCGWLASQYGLLSLLLPCSLATITATIAWRGDLDARALQRRSHRPLFTGAALVR